jgi:hypothetical protein
MAVVDLLKWVCQAHAFKIANHLTGLHTQVSTGATGPVAAYNWLDADGQKLWLIKNAAGNPPDLLTYNRKEICQWITENADTDEPGGSHWGVATAFKRHIVPVRAMPRFFDIAGGMVTLTSPGPNFYTRTLACENDGEPLLNSGNITYTTEYLASFPFGGAIGTVPCVRNTYYYGPHAREEKYYVEGKGLIRWTNASNITGSWVISEFSMHTTIAAGGCPVPNFPCYSSIPGPGFTGAWIGGVPGAGGNVDFSEPILTVRANNLSKVQGADNPALSYSITGFLDGDTQANSTTGAPTLSTTALKASPAGDYPISVAAGSLASAGYTIVYAAATLSVTPGPPAPSTTTTTLYDPPLRQPIIDVHGSGTITKPLQQWLFSVQKLSQLKLVDTSAGSYSELLPPAGLNATTGQSNQNQRLTYKKISADGNTFTLNGSDAGPLPEGAQTLTAQYSMLTVQSDGTSWHKVG